MSFAAEVERTLKKIQEGMDIFDEIWEKVGAELRAATLRLILTVLNGDIQVQEAPTQSHKEKCEQDLKKEIKKLQVSGRLIDWPAEKLPVFENVIFHTAWFISFFCSPLIQCMKNFFLIRKTNRLSR